MNKIIVIIGMAIASMVMHPLKGLAQETEAGLALQALHRMAAAYQQAHYLSFDIQYRYAAESQPGQYLDSLKGQYKIHGSRYWSLFDNQESLSDSSLLLMVFKEDNLIYLTKAPAQPAGGREAGVLTAMAMLDTLLRTQEKAVYDYSITGNEETVTVSLDGAAIPCKKISWHIDRETGLLIKMTSIVPAGQLYDPSVRSLVSEAITSYVVVETLYSNYQQNAFGEQVFDAGRYVKKEAQGYVTVGDYENYKVFVGSPGL